MQFLIQFPQLAVDIYDEWVDGGHVADAARIVETAGFGAIGVADHPFPTDDWLANEGGHHAFDPFVSLSFMAAATERVRLVTYALVAGYRNPYLTAKALASLDKLSGGRVTAGMAVGYLQREFDVLGASFSDRAPRFDAALVAMRAAWHGQSLAHDDRFYPAHGHTMLPRPCQEPGPPIWIGGNSKAALERAVVHAEGWMPFYAPSRLAHVARTEALETFDDLSRRVKDAQQQREEQGYPPLDIAFASFERFRDAKSGADALAKNLAAYEDAGVTWLMIDVRSETLEKLRADIGVIADKVLR